MVSKLAFNRYCHAIRSAYLALDLSNDVSDRALSLCDFGALEGRTQLEILNYLFDRMRERLVRVDSNLDQKIFSSAKYVWHYFHNRRVVIPLVDDEGLSWYSTENLALYDFFIETFIGMHEGVKTIYDIGGHQGVWALYYALICSPHGRVYTFEPSIVNVECAALSFLINDINNAIIIPFGIGASQESIKPYEKGLLVAGVRHEMKLMRLDHTLWEKPDFIKIDIEGYEYELVTSFPQIFDFCQNIHLEIHVPHLEARGLDYREIYRLIPFERVRVRNSIGTDSVDVGADDTLTGFCRLLITPR